MIESIPFEISKKITIIVLNTIWNGAGNRLENDFHKLGEDIVQKIKELGKIIWGKCFQGKPGLDKRFQKALEGSTADEQAINGYIKVALSHRGLFTEEVQKIANDIHVAILSLQSEDAPISMQASGDGYQNNHSQAPILEGGVYNAPVTINNTVNNNYGAQDP